MTRNRLDPIAFRIPFFAPLMQNAAVGRSPQHKSSPSYPVKTHSVGSANVPTDISKTDFRKSLVGYEISRFEVENCVTDRLIQDLRIDKTNPFIHADPGNVAFMVTGYDDDPREIYEIPEFVTFIRKASEANPCWIYFTAPESYWLQTVVFCISKTA